MQQRQRAWLVGINIAIGIAFSLSCVVISLLVTTDWLGLTSKVALLRMLRSWQQPLYVTAFVVFISGSILYARVRQRRTKNGANHDE